MNDVKIITTEKDLAVARERGLKQLYPDKTKVLVSMSTCGLAAGAGKVYEALVQGLKESNDEILVSPCGCLGYCQAEPVVSIYRPGKAKIVYQKIKPEMVDEMISLIVEGKENKQLALCQIDREQLIVSDTSKILGDRKHDPDIVDIPLYEDISFFKKQMKIVLRNCGYIDSDSIDQYIGRDGYSSILKAVTTMKPQEVIDQVKHSGLRGRGGAGFPTGMKWDFCRQAKGNPKYIICNADEGDPGAYMDRSVLEGDPHSVLEGMLIGAFAIGATEGIIYVRTEYPLAIEKLTRAIEQAEDYGFLGENIFNTDFSFKIRIVEGSGAFVCGEETALIKSIESIPAEPKNRPPFPAQSGLFGKPTNINNVETLANIAVIIARGGDWYSKIGTQKSKGTKVFSLVGKINNTGLVEVPMGISLKEIIYDIGGGILKKKNFKAVQTGGPSGGCIPKLLVDMPVDYEELAKAGSIMGSGGMVVMDEDTCMVDVARFFTEFTRDESCGKCISCRDGLDNALWLLEKITQGEGTESDLDLLEELSIGIRETSQCGLGTTAPNPVLSTIKYFRDEYLQHINDKKCRSGVCSKLFEYIIDEEVCIGCGKCKACPESCIIGENKAPHRIISEKCVKCGFCYDVCPVGSVKKV